MLIKPTLVQFACSLFISVIVCFSSLVSASETGSHAPATTSPVATTFESPPLDVIARVNGKAIYAIELQRAKKVIQANQPGQQIPSEKQKEFDLQIAAQLISAELLYQAGQKLEIKDLDKQLDDKMSQAKTKFPSIQEFENAIKALKMDEKDLREYTRRDLVISNFVEKSVAPTAAITTEESKAFYEQNLDKFNRGEAIRASHILIGTTPASSDDEKKKARKLADKLRKDLSGGADFSLLAKENSTCPSSQQGGDLGFFGKGQMVPAFEKTAFALKQGDISDVIETQFGFHIIKLTDKKGAEVVAFKDAKPRIEDFLKGQKISAAVKESVTELGKKATIEMLLK